MATENRFARTVCPRAAGTVSQRDSQRILNGFSADSYRIISGFSTALRGLSVPELLGASTVSQRESQRIRIGLSADSNRIISGFSTDSQRTLNGNLNELSTGISTDSQRILDGFNCAAQEKPTHASALAAPRMRTPPINPGAGRLRARAGASSSSATCMTGHFRI